MNNVVENDNNVERLSSKRCRRYKRHKSTDLVGVSWRVR